MGRKKKIEAVSEEPITKFVCPICGKTFEDTEDLCFYVGGMQKTCSWKCFLAHIKSLPKVEKKPGRPQRTGSLTEAWADKAEKDQEN